MAAVGGKSGSDLSKFGFLAVNNVVDMNALKNSWPESRDEEEWLHSDIRDVAFSYVNKVVEELVVRGGFYE